MKKIKCLLGMHEIKFSSRTIELGNGLIPQGFLLSPGITTVLEWRCIHCGKIQDIETVYTPPIFASNV